ncbi:MAG TPA: acetate uptake transporter [Candidatus Angelobacter sp.]|nr:acetate uptake transporter [Candidatus Angelobacter sp.]
MATVVDPTTARNPAPAPASDAASIADPGPLGLAAFALTTFVLSTFNAGILPKTVEAVVLPLALFYGGFAQMLAGMWEFKKGNTFGALAFTSYGAFWLSFAALVKFVAGDLPAADAEKGVGVFLLAWTIFTLYMTLASLRTNLVLIAVFVTLSLTFIALMVGAFAGNSGISKLGGWLGLLTAIEAWYASAAGVTASTFGRPVLPTWAR